MINKHLDSEDYEQFKKYVLLHGEYPNGDRCVIIDVLSEATWSELTMCFSDNTSDIHICDGNNYNDDGDRIKELSEIEIDNLFMDLSGQANNSEEIPDNQKNTFYIEEIEQNIKSCVA